MGLFNKKKSSGNTVSKGDIKIRVFMRFGAEIRQLRAEYFATEKRDNYNNLVAINDKFLHNEDVDFSQEDVYSSMNITLGIAGLNKGEALKKIDKQIAKYEKRVNALNNHPELNVYANVWDEKRTLRELEIYRRYLSNRSESGAYFTIANGLRIYDFESLDGFLIPIWHGADNLTDYPDFTRKKKITMQETANIENYFASKSGAKLAVNALVMVMVITAVLFGVNVYWTFQNYNWHEENVEEWAKPANYCAEQMARTYTDFTNLMKDATIVSYLEKNETIKQNYHDKIKDLNPANIDKK
jgi:hypothetical protein